MSSSHQNKNETDSLPIAGTPESPSHLSQRLHSPKRKDQERAPLSPSLRGKHFEIGPPETDDANNNTDDLPQRDGLLKAAPKQRRTKLSLPRLRSRRQYDAAIAYPASSDEDDEMDPHHGIRHTVQDDTAHWSLDEDQHNNNPTDKPFVLSETDIRMCQELDHQYERALEDRQVAWSARYQSVRQSTFLSIILMCLLIFTGTLFFLRQADNYWTVPEALLFSIYTITTVGYGHLDMPDTPAFQYYTIAFIFLGIAMLTILVAQVYQCIALEASRVTMNAGDAQARRTRMRTWLETHIQENRINNDNNHTNTMDHHLDTAHWTDVAEVMLKLWDKTRTFLRENEYGRGLSVLLPFLTLVLFGSLVIGPLEGWTFTESIYFSVVSLTTVGFGDYYPTRTISIWFCCLWLPFSVGFMSLYLANVAAFYIRLSDRNVARIERVLRRRLQRAKERAEQERRAVLRRALRGQNGRRLSSNSSGLSSEDGLALGEEGIADGSGVARKPSDVEEADETHADVGGGGGSDREGTTIQITNLAADGSNTTRHLFGTEGSSLHRRERIIQNSQRHYEFMEKSKGLDRKDSSGGGRSSMATMRDVLRTVKRNNAQLINKNGVGRESSSPHGSSRHNFQAAGPEREFLSVKAINTVLHHDSNTVRKKPSFALRALVQERFAEIIATDIAGYQSSIEIKDYTLKVTIESLKQTADKWLVPRRARKAFRAVAFEALYFVGEHGLITRGADALFSLTPFEFHQIFSPLLAALGDAETMELWLQHTQALADVDLVNDQLSRGLSYRPETRMPELSPVGRHKTQGSQSSLDGKANRSDDEPPTLS